MSRLIYKYIMYTKYNPLYIMRFLQLVPWKHESIERVLSGHQLGNRVMYGGLYQHTRVVLYLLYTQPEISFNYCIVA